MARQYGGRDPGCYGRPEGAIQHETEPWATLLERGREDEQLVHETTYEPRAPRLTLVPPELSPAVQGALRTVGIDQLYSHQSEALYKAFERKSTRLNSSHANISYAVFCLKKKKKY